MFKHLILFCLLFYFAYSSNDLMVKTFNSLSKTINYIKLHQNEVLADCIFGVFLARIFLKDVFERNKRKKHRRILRDMDEIIDYSRKWALDDYSLDVFSLIPNDLFDEKIVFNKTIYDGLAISTKIDDYVEKNTMKCFREIKNCDLSEECLSHFVNFKDLSFGYFATHKLLYMQFARAHKCLPDDPKKIKFICSKLFLEKNRPFDLLLEEISLCAWDGFWQFLDPKFLEFILSNQDVNGCFKENPKRRFSRSTKILVDGCVDHTTGLGASTLAAFYSFYFKST